MTKLDLGSIGVTLDVRSGGGHLDDAALLENFGYSTIWIAGGQLRTLEPLREVIGATETIRVGSAIIPVQVYAPEDVIALRRDLEATDPGRLIAGLGGAHGTRPLAIMNAYLDSLDAADPPVPAGARVLSALGPRMLELSRDRAAGALPMLVTPEFTARPMRIGCPPRVRDASVLVPCVAPDARGHNGPRTRPGSASSARVSRIGNSLSSS